MIDTLYFESVPSNEDCAQVGDESYVKDSRLECQALIDQITRKLGPPPLGARLYLKGNPHDFGTYYEVRMDYDTDSMEALEYAMKVDANYPDQWDEESLTFLKTNGYTQKLVFKA